MSTQVNNYFQSLPDLPKPFTATQCILFKEELLICGGANTSQCYSYHTLKKEYKYICSYPDDVKLNGHCVVQLNHSQTNPNEIHLLSFGGQNTNIMKQTFSMKYTSVWEIDDNNTQSDSKSENQSFNTWIRHNQDTNIGNFQNNLIGVRGLIGGKNNDLLFITYFPKNIEVIDLKTMRSLNGIKNSVIPREKRKFKIQHHCFVPLTMNNEKVINHFILFCHNIGLLIKYDEQNKSFHYQKLPICPAFNDFASYSFVYLHDFIFLFGGINNKIWNQCKITLPMEINLSFAILSDDDINVHVIGGSNAKYGIQKTHVSVNADELFEKSELLKMPEIYRKTIELKNEITKMKLERPYIIPIEKQRMNEDEKENKE
ncbi:hypothetical protein RFI_26687, partial [Reticulomyxa filosa]